MPYFILNLEVLLLLSVTLPCKYLVFSYPAELWWALKDFSSRFSCVKLQGPLLPHKGCAATPTGGKGDGKRVADRPRTIIDILHLPFLLPHLAKSPKPVNSVSLLRDPRTRHCLTVSKWSLANVDILAKVQRRITVVVDESMEKKWRPEKNCLQT